MELENSKNANDNFSYLGLLLLGPLYLIYKGYTKESILMFSTLILVPLVLALIIPIEKPLIDLTCILVVYALLLFQFPNYIQKKKVIVKEGISAILGRVALMIVALILFVIIEGFIAKFFNKKGTANQQDVAAPSNKRFDSVNFADFIVDFESYAGKEIILSGFFMSQSNGVGMFYEEIGSTNFIFLETAKLSKDEQKIVLQNCGSGCRANFLVTPSIILGNKGATALEIIDD